MGGLPSKSPFIAENKVACRLLGRAATLTSWLPHITGQYKQGLNSSIKHQGSRYQG